MVSNNSGGADTDPVKARLNAYGYLGHMREIAERIGCPLLIPTFTRRDDNYATSLSRNTLTAADDGPLKRPDLQLLAMIDDSRARLRQDGWELPEKILMFGFSADGMFANRFSFLHPDRVEAVAVGSPGGWPLAPLSEWSGATLRYPLGIADLGQLTGRPLDLEAIRKVDFYFFLGDKDDNDSVKYRDGYTVEDEALAFRILGKLPVDRWPIAEQMYRQAGMHSKFHLYPGIGHTVKDYVVNDVVAHFLAHLGTVREP